MTRGFAPISRATRIGLVVAMFAATSVLSVQRAVAGSARSGGDGVIRGWCQGFGHGCGFLRGLLRWWIGCLSVIVSGCIAVVPLIPLPSLATGSHRT
jgi:hypothetical protein